MKYKDAGVDLKFADEIPKIINKLKSEFFTNDKTRVGGFGGAFNLQCTKTKSHILVAGTDGVGTKTLLATKYNRYEGLGIDLVAMSVNDIATTGAKPIFFLDYIGFNKLKKNHFKTIMKSILTGCRDAGCILLGGETAELTGVYKPGDFDLVGFGVGVVDKNNLIDGKKIKARDKVLGIASTGPHSNGFTLIRKVLEKNPELEKKYLKELLTPTRIYCSLINNLILRFTVKGLAHITGGGLVGNIPRIIPKGLKLELFNGNWPVKKKIRRR